MANNVEMPLFGSASGARDISDWGGVENFDVDMLAEYLLDDGCLNVGGMTFDFNLESKLVDSTMVSPENSEDGNLPPIADSGFQQAAASLLQVPNASSIPAIPLAPAQNASAGMFLTSSQIQQFSMPPATAAASNILQQQQLAEANKRRRVDNGVAPTTMPNVASFLTGQQLAMAAAQAMDPGRGRKKSQAQIDRRRERNRILARRTRLRKKFFFESLQKEVMDLQRENEKLKDLVKTSLDGDSSQEILSACDAAERMPPGVLEACGENCDLMDAQDFNLVRSVQQSQHSFVISDPSLTDNPIVFASDDFLNLTGYSREQVLGRNCRFLQGTDTSIDSVDEIRNALANGEDVSVTLINYTADGTPFWNKLFIAALRDAQNNIVNFIGVIVKVAGPEPGHPEHGKPLPDKVDKSADPGAETTFLAVEDSLAAAVAAATGGGATQ